MKYISTIGKSPAVHFKQAVMNGMAPDGGLYIPDSVPALNPKVWTEGVGWPLPQLAFEVLQSFIGDAFTEDQLHQILKDSFDLDIPLVQCGDSGKYVLELFHGPTWAFKDVGAGFLGSCLDAWSDLSDVKTVVLVATSGDTGGAVAHGFHHRKKTDVIILYPKGKVTPLQEQQIAGWGENIHAYAIEGSFDDCQRLVKDALMMKVDDPKVQLTSANSINIARWLPQMIFYARAWQEASRLNVPLRISVPSGNYGNVSAALLWHMMGPGIDHLSAAHNANDTIPRYLSTGLYKPLPTKHTLANAMDVSEPGNFARFTYLQGMRTGLEKSFFSAYAVTDEQILNTIRDVWERHQYLLDPHTATAWYSLAASGKDGIVVATAHSYKFENVIRQALGYFPEKWIKSYTERQVQAKTIDASPAALYKVMQPLLYTK